MHPPGWYPDPSVPGQERWWGGQSFTEHVRAVERIPAWGTPAQVTTAPAQVATTPAPGWGAPAPHGMPQAPPLANDAGLGQQRYGQRPLAPTLAAPGILARQRDFHADLASGKNSHATIGFVFALLSTVGLGFGWIAGFVFGVLGLQRARRYAAAGYPPVGRTKSVWAIVLSVVGVAVSVALAVWQFQHERSDRSDSFETLIAQDAEQSELTLTVDCPGMSQPRAGYQFRCTATEPDGTSHVVDVTMQDDYFFTWELDQGGTTRG